MDELRESRDKHSGERKQWHEDIHTAVVGGYRVGEGGRGYRLIRNCYLGKIAQALTDA